MSSRPEPGNRRRLITPSTPRAGSTGARTLLEVMGLGAGVLGSAGFLGADLLRLVAFRGLGSAGAIDYGLANRLLGVAAVLLVAGMIAALVALRRDLGRAASISGLIAVTGFALLAAGSLGEFVVFTDDRDLGSASWLWFLMGLPIGAIGLTGVGLRLSRKWEGPARLVAWWLAGSLPLVIAAIALGLLGTPLALSVGLLCWLLLRERRPDPGSPPDAVVAPELPSKHLA